MYDKEFETPRDRTFGNLKYDCHRFQEEFYGKRKNAKYCHSTINPSLILEDDNILVLSKCPKDELHIRPEQNYGDILQSLPNLFSK